MKVPALSLVFFLGAATASPAQATKPAPPAPIEVKIDSDRLAWSRRSDCGSGEVTFS
jgi:hypothetical protein